MKPPYVIVAVLIAIAAVAGWLAWDKAAPAYRTPAPDLARIPQGPPVDPALLPTTPVAAWNASGLRGWMSTTLTALDSEITDPEVRRLGQAAAETALNATDEAFYDASNSALPLLYESDAPEDHRKGLYILLKAATSGRDEPFTFLRLGSYLEERPLDDGSQFVADAYRLAADRDFLPAIVNLSVYASDNPGFPPDDLEAYLHYGFNLEATDGRWHIIGPLINFYLLDQPDRDTKGYLHLAAERYRELGDEKSAALTEYRMYLHTREVMPDAEAELTAAKRAVAAGNLWVANDIGLTYMQDGPLYDRDLARDYFVACLTGLEPDNLCAVNLGSLYTNYDRGSVDLPLAIAFWKYAFELDPESNPDILNAVAEDMATRVHELSPDELILTDRYLTAILAEDYSGLPHVKDARPVPDMAKFARPN